MFRFLLALVAVALLASAVPSSAPAADFFVANSDGTFTHVRSGPFGAVRSFTAFNAPAYIAPTSSFGAFTVRSASYSPFGVYSLSDHCGNQSAPAAFGVSSVPFGVRNRIFIVH